MTEKKKAYYCPDCGRRVELQEKNVGESDDFDEVYTYCPTDGCGWMNNKSFLTEPIYFRLIGMEWQDQDVFTVSGDGWHKERVCTSPVIIYKNRTTKGYELMEQARECNKNSKHEDPDQPGYYSGMSYGFAREDDFCPEDLKRGYC